MGTRGEPYQDSLLPRQDRRHQVGYARVNFTQVTRLKYVRESEFWEAHHHRANHTDIQTVFYTQVGLFELSRDGPHNT